LDPTEEALKGLLQKNEIKSGVDFKFWKSQREFESTIVDTSQLLSTEMIESVRDVFANPTTCESSFNTAESTVINEETRINIVAQKSMLTLLDTHMDIMQILGDLCDCEADEEMTNEEILQKLSMLNFGENHQSNMRKFDKSFQQVLDKFMLSDSEKEKDVSQSLSLTPVAHHVRETRSLSLLQTPGIRSLSSFLSPQSQNLSIATRSVTRTRERALRSLSNASERSNFLQVPTIVRSANASERSNFLQVPTSVRPVNAKMKRFEEKFLKKN
jgi:hypothetical protein